MSKPWVALWKADLLSSINYKSLSVYERGIYNILFTLCRDDEYIGQLCYPNGNRMTLDQIIDSMDLKRGDRRDRIKKGIEVMLNNGLVLWNDKGRLEIRKYAEKTQHIDKKSAHSSPEVGTKLAHSSPKSSTDNPIQHNTVTTQHNTEDNIYIVVFHYWNDKSILIHHHKFTNKIKAKIITTTKDYSELQIREAIDNYVEVLSNPDKYFFTYKWTLSDFLQRGLERFLTTAQPLINFKIKEQKNATIQSTDRGGKGEDNHKYDHLTQEYKV